MNNPTTSATHTVSMFFFFCRSFISLDKHPIRMEAPLRLGGQATRPRRRHTNVMLFEKVRVRFPRAK